MLGTKEPEKQLIEILPKNSGRDNAGHVSIRHQGGRSKRYYRQVDFFRSKVDIKARVVAIEYDPNRNAFLALLQYSDGEKAYILAPEGVKLNDLLEAGKNVEIRPGNALPLGSIPVGTFIHNVELVPGKGAKLIRAAGSAATVLSREGVFIQVKFASGEIHRINALCMATVGQVGNGEWRHRQIGKAGRARHMGLRPEVRGVAQNPRSHPHGGGEGRSGIGFKSPKSPWGKRTLGKKTRKPHKYSDKFIISRRKK
jgi:large subunit ribosomal protein L2